MTTPEEIRAIVREIPSKMLTEGILPCCQQPNKHLQVLDILDDFWKGRLLWEIKKAFERHPAEGRIAVFGLMGHRRHDLIHDICNSSFLPEGWKLAVNKLERLHIVHGTNGVLMIDFYPADITDRLRGLDADHFIYVMPIKSPYQKPLPPCVCCEWKLEKMPVWKSRDREERLRFLYSDKGDNEFLSECKGAVLP